MESEKFSSRHIGISGEHLHTMLAKVNASSPEELVKEVVPDKIRLKTPLQLPAAMTEAEFLKHITALSEKNRIYTSYIGRGWYETITPSPILRHILENPVWYTSYTPYQAEISQGRLKALLNFQTMVSELTGLPVANASLLNEGTAAAEAAGMMFALRNNEKKNKKATVLLVDARVFSHSLAVLNTHCLPLGIELKVQNSAEFDYTEEVFGIILQYPDADGNIKEYTDVVKKAGEINAKVAVCADLLALCLLKPPGEWGADIVFGSSQHLGIPMYYGGPSAAFFATKEEYKRQMPGRIIGISKDAYGKQALRMALQTREQHIKREKATSNICTAQALLAVMAGFYAVYHGPAGLKKIAMRIHSMTSFFARKMKDMGYKLLNKNYFDTLKFTLPENVSLKVIRQIAEDKKINIFYFETGEIGISLNETTTTKDLVKLLSVFSSGAEIEHAFSEKDIKREISIEEKFLRKSDYLTQKVFQKYHTETEFMRYIKKLERRDISLTHSMIPLGSCTMKLNAVSGLLPLNFPGFRDIHPYAPKEQVAGYTELLSGLGDYLGEITGLPGVTFQPDSGAAGEYTGLSILRQYFLHKNEPQRNLMLIPASAHGTNPASAVQAGFEILVVKCDENGNIDLEDLAAKAKEHASTLAGCMITYPSTHGIFEEHVEEICNLVHALGGQVYMDGANMNAQVGVTNPGIIGADVCHLNLHKTFASPHGGGGPGVGPVCVAEHLIPFLPQHPFLSGTLNTVSASPYGNAGILPVSYAYIRLMGADGLTEATKIAILNANYLAACLKDSYGMVYKGKNGRVGHEMILECRKFKSTAGITETDIAKRLMDFGFHAPTLSFPVAGTLMIEPTESESLEELDRFIAAMECIYREIKEVEEGKYDRKDNVLVNAPHPEYRICSDEWEHTYSRKKAAFPLPYTEENKFWIQVARVDNAFGDRNLFPKLTE